MNKYKPTIQDKNTVRAVQKALKKGEEFRAYFSKEQNAVRLLSKSFGPPDTYDSVSHSISKSVEIQLLKYKTKFPMKHIFFPLFFWFFAIMGISILTNSLRLYLAILLAVVGYHIFQMWWKYAMEQWEKDDDRNERIEDMLDRLG